MLEKQLIKQYFEPLTNNDQGAANLSDDVATLNDLGTGLVALNMDSLVASVHFFENDPAELVAKKALRTNLSDIASKGCDATAYLLSIAIPKNCNENFIRGFCNGLKQDQEKYGLSLLGGDTVKTPGPLTLTITMFGLLPEQKITRRANAEIGDDIYVTGTIGNGALGLLSHPEYQDADKITNGFKSHLDHFLCPEPRVELKTILRKYANASMDISDGLIGDLQTLLAASNKGAHIDLNKVALHQDSHALLHKNPQLINKILKGGDDYEILFTCPKKYREEIRAEAAKLPFGLSNIGEIKDDKKIKYNHDYEALILDNAEHSHNHQW